MQNRFRLAAVNCAGDERLSNFFQKIFISRNLSGRFVVWYNREMERDAASNENFTAVPQAALPEGV